MGLRCFRPAFALAVLLSLAAAPVARAADEDVPAPPSDAVAPEASPQATPAAAEASVPAAEAGPRGARDASAPRGAMRTFLDACRAGDFGKAASLLDLSDVAPADRAAQGPVLARHLKVVLDRKLWVDLGRLSERATGASNDGLPADVDRVGAVESASGPVDVLLQRFPTEGPHGTWKIAATTVDQVPLLYDQFGYGTLGEVLPDAFFRIAFLEVQLWQWIALLLLLLVAFGVARLVTWILHRIAVPFIQRTETTLDDLILALMVRPARLLIGLALFWTGTLSLGLAVPARKALGEGVKALVIVAVTWFLVRITHVFAGFLEERLRRDDRKGGLAVLPLGRRVAKALIVILATLVVLQTFGVNVTGVLAGLGVGGLAVALAAQKTLENLFGGVTVITDQPVRVGDFCKFGDQVGTVEDVGLRSTRIRTLDRTIVTVPNAEFASGKIENFARRDRIRLYTKLGLRYETTPDQMRWVLAAIKRLLASHPKVDPDPARVRFVGFGAFSLDLEIFAFVQTTDYNEFLAIQEDLFLRLMDIVNQSGSGFAFPSSTTYLGKDTGLDTGLQKKAEDEVQAWRAAGSLPFPAYPPQALDGMKSSLDWPPKGSAVAPPEVEPGAQGI